MWGVSETEIWDYSWKLAWAIERVGKDSLAQKLGILFQPYVWNIISYLSDLDKKTIGYWS